MSAKDLNKNAKNWKYTASRDLCFETLLCRPNNVAWMWKLVNCIYVTEKEQERLFKELINSLRGLKLRLDIHTYPIT